MTIPFETKYNTSAFKKALPHWCNYSRKDGYIEIDPDRMFVACMKFIQVRPDKYWLEVSRRCITEYIKEKLFQFNESLSIRYIKTKKNKTKLSKYHKGDAKKGALDFRAYYSQIKNELEKY